MIIPYNYNIFFDFIESYMSSDFQSVNPTDPIVQKLEEDLKLNNQFFSVADLGKMQFIYTSAGSKSMMGVDPEEIHPGHFLDVIHPDDSERFGLARALLFRIERDLFKNAKGSKLLSASFRFRNPAGEYINLLIQCYIFYSLIPKPVVYDLQHYTVIDSFGLNKKKFHHYLGDDLSLFRFPDIELLNMGPPFSKREFEIIKLVEAGMNSQEIADKLFLSTHTVTTHRSNILEKSGKASISDLIYELEQQGLL